MSRPLVQDDFSVIRHPFVLHYGATHGMDPDGTDRFSQDRTAKSDGPATRPTHRLTYARAICVSFVEYGND